MPSVLKTIDLLLNRHSIPDELKELIIRFLWFHDIILELTDPGLHRGIKRCVGNTLRGILDNIHYGRLMIHYKFPKNFVDIPRLFSIKGPVSSFKPYKSLSIGTLDFTTWGGSPESNVRWPDFMRMDLRPETSTGLNLSSIAPVDYVPEFWDEVFPSPEERIIYAINNATGAWFEEESGTGRQIEGLNEMSLQELYHTFMKLPEFEEE